MSKCKECGVELEQTPGRRAKEFCSSTCRSNHWQKENRKKKSLHPLIDELGVSPGIIPGTELKPSMALMEFSKHLVKEMNKPRKEKVITISPEAMETFNEALKEVVIKDLNQPTHQVKNITQPAQRSNTTINTRKPFMSDAIRKKNGL